MSRKQVRWRQRALSDLQAIHDWLATLDGADPQRAIERIRAAADAMVRLGDIGRPSVEPGLRELSVRHAPYVIAYRVSGDDIDIIAVYHTAQRR